MRYVGRFAAAWLPPFTTRFEPPVSNVQCSMSRHAPTTRVYTAHANLPFLNTQVQRKIDDDHTSTLRQIDIPSRDAGFFGVPNKEMVFLQPCTDCLVNLTERPPFVLSLDDIQVCAFFCVCFSLSPYLPFSLSISLSLSLSLSMSRGV